MGCERELRPNLVSTVDVSRGGGSVSLSSAL